MRRLSAAALIWVLAAGACARSGDTPDADRPAPAGPFVRVLGTAQDGGFPHVACSHELCVRARREPDLGRRVASLAVVLPEAGSNGGPESGSSRGSSSGRVYLVDATPDLPEQLEHLADVRDPPAGGVDRAPVDGIFLTHAHVGHYLGLAWLGYEALHTRGLPVWCTPRMARFLRENGPWSQLVRPVQGPADSNPRTFPRGNVELRELDPASEDGGAVELGAGVTVRAVAVPHRDEYTDTVGYRIEGPRATVLYVPDTDSWDAWGGGLAEALDGVDVALLDATFYSADELPGREVSEIGHPLVTDSLERFGAAVRAGRLRVLFTHLNHSNPALDPESPERRTIEEAGFRVAEEGEEIGL